MNQIDTNAVVILSLAMGSAAIEMQEAHGAASVRNSQQIPRDNPGREVLASLGIEVGEDDPNDRLFVNATFPGGWHRVATGSAYWTHFVPPWSVGPVLKVFYKAAFYDRSAAMHIGDRYDITGWSDDNETKLNVMRVRDLGTGETLFTTPIVRKGTSNQWRDEDDARAVCVKWANDNLPEGWDKPATAWRWLYERSLNANPIP